MACCAAAIFILCQLVFGFRRVLRLVSGGRLGADDHASASDGVVSWRLYASADGADGPAPAASSAPRRAGGLSSRQLGLAGGVLVAAFSAAFILTKPGIPSPIPQSELTAQIHASICGSPRS